jgi:hypothetical protein
MTDSQGGDRRMSRRRFLQAAAIGGGALALAGTGYGIDSALTGGGPPKPGPRFLSAPDLEPPPVKVLVPGAGTAEGFVAVTPWQATRGQRGPLLVDNNAQPVWFRDVAPQAASNFQVQQYRGQPVLTWWQGELILPGYGRGEYHLLDTSYREVTTVAAADGFSGDLHEFLITPQGTALFTAYRSHPADLSAVGGPDNGVLLDSYIQELDIASGELLFAWQASKHVALDESYMAPPAGKTPYDFFHINSIDPDHDGNLVLSARHTWTVYKISRQTGEVMWRLGGKKSSFAMGSGEHFAWQHDARVRPGNAISLFDDGGGATNVETRSRGMVLALDMANKRAALTAQYYPDPSFVSTSQGSVQALGNGNTFVGWGEQPYFSEYSAQGELLFVGQLPPQGSYRAYRFPWKGQPTDRPAVVVQRNPGGSAAVYASWNGATEVTRWQVSSGPSPRALAPRGESATDGFETVLVLRNPGRYAAVAAFDAQGNLLGRSRVVAV